MKFTKIKQSLVRFFQILVITAATATPLLVASPVSAVAAGALCVIGDASQQINLNIDSEAQACQNAGGKVIREGEPVTVPICVLGDRLTQMSANQSSRDGCRGTGGTVVEVGGALPAIEAPEDPNANDEFEAQKSTIDCSAQATDESARCEVTQDCVDKDGSGAVSKSNCGITRYLILFINALSGLVGIIVVAVLVIGGIQYSTSAGDPNAVAAARKRISNALLALVAFGLMYGFLQWIVPGGVL